jgi:hypothetical protein
MPVVVSVDVGGTGANNSATALTNLGAAPIAAYAQANAAYAQANNGIGPKVTTLIYPGNDTAVNTAGGQTVYIVGSGFKSNSTVYINGNVVPSVSYISAANLSITTPALNTGVYPVYVINPEDGATAIKIPGLLVSGEPTWNTAAGSLSSSQDAASAWSYTVQATSDSAITYTLAAGSSLPTGVNLASNGLISGTITSPPTSQTTYTFSVVATDAEFQDSTRQFSVTVTVGEGLLFANTVLLIHADATNNKNNHTFLDSSNNNFAIVRGANTTQGSFSPFSQTGWSNYFDGSGDRFTIANSSELDQVGDYCQEGWIYPIKGQTFLGFGYKDVNNYVYFGIQNDKWSVNAHNTGEIIQGSVVQYNQWTHVALTRQGSTVRLFVNGVLVGSTTNSNNISGTGTYYLGRTGDNNWNVYGYVSNWRVTKGSVPTSYQTSSTSNGTTIFTPPSSILSINSQGASNTVLLSCQSNRFVDNSVNNFTLSLEGDVSVQPFSPFAPTEAYSTTNVTGAAYFDTTSYLSIADNAALDMGSSNFTIEGWYYPMGSASSSTAIFSKRANGSVVGGILVYYGGNGLTPSLLVDIGGSWAINIQSSVAFRANQWNHFAVVRNGSAFNLYINGVSGVSATNAGTIPDNAAAFVIGAMGENGSGPISACYMSNFRVVKGTAIYTGAFTPPTAPLTVIANTSLHCNFTNAGIFDQTSKNIFITAGDAKTSTAQFKYGNSSIAFDGTGDAVIARTTPLLAFGTNDFTVEAWVYIVSGTSFGCVVGGPSGGSTWYLEYSSNRGFYFYDNANALNGNSAIVTGAWKHLAVSRSGSALRMFVDGNVTATHTSTSTMPQIALAIGAYNDNTYNINGYIDELRISRFARYTANFTPSAAAFPDK